MRTWGLGLLLGWAAMGVAQAAEIISAAPMAVELTLYRDGTSASTAGIIAGTAGDQLAMVREQRRFEVPAGRVRLVFRGVAALTVPQTARLTGLPGRVLERNFDYDLLSPGALLAKSLGKPVRAVRTDRRTGASTELAGVLRSGVTGMVIESEGRAEPLGCGDSADKLIFDTVPAGLIAVPTLSMDVMIERAGSYQLELSYLAEGLAWSADYVVRLHPDGRSLNLTGWLSVGNVSATTFANVPLRALAGKLAIEYETAAVAPSLLRRETGCWPPPRYFQRSPAPARSADMSDAVVVTGSYIREVEPEELGDYKLYKLPETTTLAARQSKQVQFLERLAVPFERVYRVYVDAQADQTPRQLLRLQNKRAANLGVPLPAGTFIVYQPDARGPLVYAGEAMLRDTPVNQRIELYLRDALDISVQRTTLQKERRQRRRGSEVRERVRLEISNDKTVAVELELVQEPPGANFRVRRASARFQRLLGDVVWSLRLEPGERRELQYTVQWVEAEDE